MNVYVIISWSKKTGVKCIGLNMNERTARNVAEHAVENYIDFSGCGGLPTNNENGTEFWAENDPDGFFVRIEAKKLYVNFANC